MHSNPYNPIFDPHPLNSHKKPQPYPATRLILELSLLKYNLSQFIDFDISFFKDMV
jgi:hypothetical protein